MSVEPTNEEMSSHLYDVQAKPFVPQPQGQGQGKNGSRDRNGGGMKERPPKHRNRNQNNANRNGPRKKEPAQSNRQNYSRKAQDWTQDLDTFQRNKRGEISISHLADFSFSRPHHTHHFHHPPRRSQPSHRRHHDPEAERQAYLNTVCRFILDPRDDYKSLLHDPDTPPPMEMVQRIVTQPSPCPICLEDIPEAPRMLECGHVLCYPCLFRYLKSEGLLPADGSKPKKQKECPLCFERVRVSKIKPVTFTHGNDLFDTPTADNETALKLMFRPHGAIFAAPKSDVTFNCFDEVPWTTTENSISHYSRISRGSEEYLVSELDREIRQLGESRETNKLLYNDSGEFHTQAIDMIKAYKETMSEGGSSESPEQDQTPAPDTTTFDPHEPSTPVVDWEAVSNANMNSQFSEMSLTDQDASNADVGQNSVPVSNGEQHSRPLDKNFVSKFDDSSAYFFYQTGFDSGTKFFLAPLDVRILKQAYAHYCNFPEMLVLKVENVLYGTYMTPEVRKRMKYLSHLPLNTPIGFLECDWRGIIPDEVLRTFTKDLSARRKRKKEKDRKEDRERARMQRAEEENLRRELIEESSFSFYRPSRHLLSENDAVADTEEEHDPELPRTEPVAQPSTSPKGVSFAAVASGEASGVDHDKELEQLLAQATTRKGRKGGKKLVLMSNTGRRMS
uniref:ARAD1D26510p n=1 Tax=Blastobotrys adeninivorans TaxID=409370 RepID=A0A060TBB1_BLAAD